MQAYLLVNVRFVLFLKVSQRHPQTLHLHATLMQLSLQLHTQMNNGYVLTGILAYCIIYTLNSI